MLKWLSWKVVLVAALIGLGINGLTQVGLSKDMHAKTSQLAAQVQTAQQLSGQMKDSINGLQDVQKSTASMAGTLAQLDQTTANMDQGLATLEHTVQGLSSTIHQIGTGTDATSQSLGDALTAAKSLLSTLDAVQSRNTSIIAQLNRMVSYQAAINHNLHEMNQKTAYLP